MTKFAQLLLVMTSLAPTGVVLAGALAWHHEYCHALLAAMPAVVLVAVCTLLLSGFDKHVSATPRQISEPTTKESEPLAFLVAYALPLVAGMPSGVNWGGVLAFVLIMGLVLWQGQIFYVNPLLALVGYHFFSAKNDGGGPMLIVSRRKNLLAGTLHLARVSDYFWLDRPSVAESTGGLRGRIDRDGEQRGGP